MVMSDKKYSRSFAVGALLYRESVIVVELYIELNDWDAVRNRVIENNLLPIRTQSRAAHIYREVSMRLRKLSEPQLDLFIEGSRYEQNYLLWLAICKHYHFIHRFSIEVIREKYLRLDLVLTHDDYDLFFLRQS